MLEKINQIENFFLEIENLIKLRNKTLNQSEIEQKFKEGKNLIDKLEEDDEERHGLFRYKYHITYANYLEFSGEGDRASKQEKLAKKFENFSEKPERIDTYRTEPRLFVDVALGNIYQASNQEEENIHEAVEKELRGVKDILDDNVIEFFRNTFQQFNNLPKSFEDYKNIVAYEIILRKIADNPINESLIYLENSHTKDTSKDQKSKINKENKQRMTSSLNELKSLASKAAYSKRLAFIYHVLNSPNKKEILFSNTLFTEEEINKRFRDIALYLHSDKTNRPNTPTWLQVKHKNLGDELFNFALEIKKSLLDDLEGISPNVQEKKANDFWKIAIDYRNAAEGQWNKLRVLHRDKIKEFSSEELKIFCIDNGMLAYQEYRSACKIADKAEQLKKQDFFEANKIFEKVKDGMVDVTVITEKLDSEIKLKSKFDNIKTVDQKISLFEKKANQNSINNEVIKISMLRADRKLVRYQVNLHTKSHGKEEQEIRENLNKIMTKTIEAYDKGEYQEVINVLSEEYNKKTNDSLLKLVKREDFINTDHIIETLLKHGFRFDGIAYLLNLLGEVLSSEKTKIKAMITTDLKKLAMNVFNGVLSEKLEKEAKTLDDHIYELRMKLNPPSIFDKFKDPIITQEDKDHSQEMPFQSRLEEIRNVTKINRAISDILVAGKEEIERAIKTIKEIQDSIGSNYQFVSGARHEVLEDLLWIINGEESPSEESFKESPKESSEESPKLDGEFISYLNEQLKQELSSQNKMLLYNTLAAIHEQLAEKEDKINRLNRLKSLYYWKVAQKNYEKAREIDPKNLEAALGITKCSLKLSKYTQVIRLIDTNPNLTSSSEYWRFRSIAYCKQINYSEAKGNIIEALRLDHKNKLADEQRLFLKKLSEENTIKWRINRYEKGKKKIKYEIDYLENSHSKESSTYNILSIDGGGIGGILPALWLSEIEYRTHRPISHLFNMIAGTSTGGFIAAGLSVPSWCELYDSPYYKCSDSKPKSSASDILNLFQNQARNLITIPDNSWSLFKPKHENQDCRSFFSEYFGRVRLGKALTELVIPTVDVNDLTQTHLYTRNDDRRNYLKNDTFVDTLMATTVAPTLFPSYEMEGRSFFLDGTLHLNNSTMAAYEKAIQYNAEKEKISVLSLGTGSYIPDSLNPSQYRGNLFLTHYLHKVVLPQQENNTDRLMYSLLDNRYQRWQVWFEEPVEFGNYEEENIHNILELGHQYIEELDASDNNPINKLVESFEKKVEIFNV
ncbi:patatin [Rhizophagus irregularis DAOM 181602=DAOM 197198]|nr:patatin [Rhizophagus irregularis DAOM 181602=DAOM 197198]